MDGFIKNNYHAHTWRCKHAQGTERDLIETAIDMGMTTFGFSDHVPCPYPNNFVSTIRMDMEQAEEYRECIGKLAAEYKSQIQIYVGFEAEYVPEFFEQQMKMYQEFDFEYLIMGQHFLGTGEIDGEWSGTPHTKESYLKQYVDTLIEGAKTGMFKYICHPDMVNYLGDEEIYRKHIYRLCQEMKNMHIPMEINNLGMSTGRQYPAERFWKIAGEVGVDGIIGLDAHCTEHVRDFTNYQKCVDLAKRNNIHLLDKITI